MEAVEAIGIRTRGQAAPAAKELRESADKLVGSIFYGTLLRQLRASTIKGEYGHGGRGEDVFQAQLDQILAQKMGRARSTNLTDAIVKRLGHQAELMESLHSRQRQDFDILRQGFDAAARVNEPKEKR